MFQGGHTVLYSQQQCTRGWSWSTFSIFVIVNVFDFSQFSCVGVASYDLNLHLSNETCIYTSFNVFVIHISSLAKFLFKVFPSFKNSAGLSSHFYLQEFFISSGYETAIKCMFCKNYLPVCASPFHFLSVFQTAEKSLLLMIFNSSLSSFITLFFKGM